jgi:hypothetical protein
MSARYYDVGSGPHDVEPRDDGQGICGCRHDGTRWLSMCDLAAAEQRGIHEAAALEHAARVATVGDA